MHSCQYSQGSASALFLLLTLGPAGAWPVNAVDIFSESSSPVPAPAVIVIVIIIAIMIAVIVLCCRRRGRRAVTTAHNFTPMAGNHAYYALPLYPYP
jgi:hypothetical protein